MPPHILSLNFNINIYYPNYENNGDRNGLLVVISLKKFLNMDILFKHRQKGGRKKS